MAATVSSSTPNPIRLTSQPPKRPPLLPSTDTHTALRKPKFKEVTSRYLSTPSPLGSRTAPIPENSVITNRSRSVERRRPEGKTMTAAEKLLVGNGFKRSLNVSFQVENVKPAPTTGDENWRPREERRWPGKDFTKSLDCGGMKALHLLQSVDDDHSSLSSVSASDLASSDKESVTSRRPRAKAVPARFCEDTTNRLERLPEQHSPKNSFTDDNPVSPPSKVPSTLSPSRGKLSPSRVRSVVRNMMNERVSNTPSIHSSAADTRRGNVGENKNAYIHELRMLYNRHLQWRFANARAASVMQVRKDMAEKSLYNAWAETLELRNSVKSKRLELQQLRQQLKLYSLLKEQMTYLDDWELFDGDFSSCLAGAVESLEASTLRLPLVGGAKANIQEVEDTISSAVDVMQGIGSSLYGLLEKVVQTSSLASELASISLNEHASLDQCRDLLSTVTAMQVEDCSMRTQLLQLARV